MITLKTGVPGSGKTLTAVAELLKASRADLAVIDRAAGGSDKVPALRPLFVHGIPDLAIPHCVLPVLVSLPPPGDRNPTVTTGPLQVDWDQVPPGALVVIDEAQHIFPVRGAGAKTPSYVGWLNTHRHKGIDIILLTQHPKLLDQAVRKLVGKHQHYRRLFGGQRHASYEWDSCNDNLTSFKTAQMVVANFPKAAYAAYRSAEIHTKQRFRLPLWLVVPVLGLVGGLFLVPKAVVLFGGAIAGKGISAPGAAASAPGAVASAPGPLPVYPVPPALLTFVPESVIPVARVMPYYLAGCWNDQVQCRCMSNGVPARVLTGLGPLCVQVALGQLVPHPARPVPVRAVEAVPAGIASPPGPAGSAPVLSAGPGRPPLPGA